MPATASAVQAGRVEEPDQLSLQFFAVVGGMHSAPPERALWRELLDLALGTAKTLTAPDGRAVSASVAWAVGAAVYFRANSRGVVEGFSHDVLAADCRIDPRTARSALKVLAFLRIVAFKAGPRRPQRGPRPRALHMNLGGLDWPAVRRRAKLEQTKQASLLPGNSGHHARQSEHNTGHHARQSDGNSGHHARQSEHNTGHHARQSEHNTGHHARQSDGNSGHHARQSDANGGHRARHSDGNSGHDAHQQRATAERATNLAVAAGTPEGGKDVPDHHAEQQQQGTTTTTNTTREPAPLTEGTEPDEAREKQWRRRVEGLIAAIASRSRGLHRPFDEADCRRALATGELTIDQLQTRADELQAELTSAEANRPAVSGAKRRGRGRYDRPDLTDEEQRIYEASGGNPWAVERYREDKAD